MDFTITRTLNAPRSKVWEAFTVGEILVQWATPVGFTNLDGGMELSVGGTWYATMKSPDGQTHHLQGTYKEISEPERLSYTHMWVYGDVASPETLISLTFTEDGDDTVIQMTQSGFVHEQARDGHKMGWGGCLDVLAGMLEN
jgi:uncharacterized protein YndB with AHSA1/START domain